MQVHSVACRDFDTSHNDISFFDVAGEPTICYLSDFYAKFITMSSKVLAGMGIALKALT